MKPTDYAVLVIALAMAGTAGYLGAKAGQAAGQQEIREQVAARSLGQFYTDPKTGKIDFQYVDLNAYTDSLYRALLPPRPPASASTR